MHAAEGLGDECLRDLIGWSRCANFGWIWACWRRIQTEAAEWSGYADVWPADCACFARRCSCSFFLEEKISAHGLHVFLLIDRFCMFILLCLNVLFLNVLVLAQFEWFKSRSLCFSPIAVWPLWRLHVAWFFDSPIYIVPLRWGHSGIAKIQAMESFKRSRCLLVNVVLPLNTILPMDVVQLATVLSGKD